MSAPTLGIIGSSGGSALAAAADCLADAGIHQKWFVITDRDCGLLDWARSKGHAAYNIPYTDAQAFSSNALKLFNCAGVNQILLFYTRRLTAPLIDAANLCNIHPSLLPAYPGLGSVRRAMKAGCRTIGATLHRVDAGLDTGRVIAQVSSPVPENADMSLAEHISYVQKVRLTLFWRQQAMQQDCTSPTIQLTDEVRAAFDRFAASSSFDFVIQECAPRCD